MSPYPPTWHVRPDGTIVISVERTGVQSGIGRVLAGLWSVLSLTSAPPPTHQSPTSVVVSVIGRFHYLRRVEIIDFPDLDAAYEAIPDIQRRVDAGELDHHLTR